MGLQKKPQESHGSDGSPYLSIDDDGAAAAAIAAAKAAAAADGLVLRGDHGGGGGENPYGASDIDVLDSRSPQSPSVEMQRGGDGMQQMHRQHGRSASREQSDFAPASGADTLARGQEEGGRGSGLPFRQLGPQQQQQKQVLRILMQEDETTPDKQQEVEDEPFSLFASPGQAFASSCCDRHAPRQQAADASSTNGFSTSTTPGGATPMPVREEGRQGCNWKTFASSLDAELDAMLDVIERSGVLEKMQLSLAASLSSPVFALPRAKGARVGELANQSALSVSPTSAPQIPSIKANPLSSGLPTGTDATTSGEQDVPFVESGGIFAALAAVESQCNEIARKFSEKIAVMRRMRPPRYQQRPWQQRQHLQQQIKPYQPTSAYGRGQQMPLFPYRNTAPSPESLQQLRSRRTRFQRLADKRGSWEVREELLHVNASFSDAAWFSLGCCAGRTWRQLLRSSGLTAGQQLELLRQLQGDDLVEGCFVIDTIRSNRAVSRHVVSGRHGRRDFMKALCSPRAVARGWVIRCDRDRDLMLLRLVGVEVYPSNTSIFKTEAKEESPANSGVKQEIPAPTTTKEAPSSGSTAGYLQRRLLRAEVDIGSSGIYAALPLAAIPRYEFIGGQVSGCCGRFVCAGTALRVCLMTDAAAAPAGSATSNRCGATDSRARLEQPLLDETTLNLAHAHVEASFALAEEFRKDAALAGLLQEPLGFASSLPHDAAHPQPEAADFEEIMPLKLPPNADSNEPLLWWDGGCGLLLSRLPYMLRSSGSFANPTATHRQLHAFSVLHLLEMAPPPENKESSTVSGTASGSNGCKKSATNDSNRTQVYTETAAWEAVLKRLSDGTFMSFLSTASPCDAIRCALARAERDPVVRGGGMGRLLAQQQGADWAKRRLKAGVACARRQQLDQALQLYDSALQLRPDYADALIARGAAYANKLEYKKAAADLDAALALEPNNKNAAKYRAIVTERMEGKEPGKTLAAADRDRTPSPDRKCKSPEHAHLLEMAASRATTIIRKGPQGSVPLLASRSALSNAAAAANAVLEQASSSGVAKGGAPLIRSTDMIQRLRNQHEQQRQHLMLLEQQKRRAALVQKQLQHSKEMERQISERKRQQKEQQQAAPNTSSTRREKSSKSSQNKSTSKRKRKHSDSSSGSSGG